MDLKTPPPRTVSLVLEDPASPPEEYSNSPPFPHTPLVRSGSPTVSRLQIGFKQPNATHLVTPTKPNIGPVTPQSTLDSSDGSHLRTPSGNFAPWNGASPDILSTPTPIGIFASSKLASKLDGKLYGHSQLMLIRDEPDADKAVAVVKAKAAKVDLAQQSSEELNEHLPTKEPIVNLSREQAHSSSETPVPGAGLTVRESSPVEQKSCTKITDHIEPQRQSLKKTNVPNSILEWLNSPTRPRRPVLQTESVQSTPRKEILRRRLAIFGHHDPMSYKTLYPIEHHLGRVVRPREKENYDEDLFEIDGWSDDAFSWSLPPLAREDDVRKRQKELRLIERYLDSNSDSEGASGEEILHENDPADAKMAFRVKRSSRVWLANKAARIHSPLPTPPKPHTPIRQSKRIRAPSVTETEPLADMEVDKVDEEDSDEIACICKGVDDGRPMVQCDKCHTWHHVDCVGKTEEELPDKWFCWKCPMDAAPERANNVQEPTLVQSTSDYSPGVQYRSAVNMPIYQGNAASETSPTLASPSKLQKNSSSFEGQHPYGQRTPPSGASIPRYSYTPWSEEMSRHDDDPMTAIASTAFGSSSFAPSPYPQFDEMAFGSLSASPSRMIGSKFNPASISITPKKERPWTNYIGTYSTSGGSIATAGYNPFVQQSSIQADPLFIHYEHDAPKQTAHHGSKGKKRGKGKEKETSKGSVEPKEDDMSVPTSAQSEEPPKGDKMLYENEPSLSGEENTDGLEPPANDESSMTV
ncbi:hypothetical protein FRC20_009377 [Serendipita sp. 405]|nr:hypothetical protein FRC15_006348 [Serendipita sp. 397]KAG8878092.1 hypothetical protein FRC20_009377 [Serendipita sp. 405]